MEIWVNLTDANNFTAQIGIYFKSTGNANYLPVEDAVSIAGRKYNFYTQSTSEDLIIDVQDAFDLSKVIPIGITNITGQNQQFTISIPKKSGIFLTQEVYLFDRITQTYHNLCSGNFTFNSNDAIVENRFSLVFTQNSNNLAKTSLSEGFEIKLLENELTVKSNAKNIKNVKVYDIYSVNASGLKVGESLNKNSKEVTVSINTKPQLLSVEIEFIDGSIERKKVMK